MQSKESLAYNTNSQGFTVQLYDLLIIQQCAVWCLQSIILPSFTDPFIFTFHCHAFFQIISIYPLTNCSQNGFSPLNSKFFSTMPIMVKPVCGNISWTIRLQFWYILIHFFKHLLAMSELWAASKAVSGHIRMAPKAVICMWYECLFLQENSWSSQKRFVFYFILFFKGFKFLSVLNKPVQNNPGSENPKRIWEKE